MRTRRLSSNRARKARLERQLQYERDGTVAATEQRRSVEKIRVRGKDVPGRRCGNRHAPRVENISIAEGVVLVVENVKDASSNLSESAPPKIVPFPHVPLPYAKPSTLPRVSS